MTILLTALTMTVHPFTGVLLTLLLAARGCQLAVQRDGRWRHASYGLIGGFALGSLWPAYSLSYAMSETGLPGGLFVAVAAAAPLLISACAYTWPVWLTVALGETFMRYLATRSKAYWLAIGGFVIVLALGFWAAALANRPPSDPLITTNRLSTYWVEDRWRWPLMLAVGAIGIYGLARLATRGRIVPAVWFAGCFTLGTIGALGSLAGIQIPIWYRFLLAAQIPLAVGVAAAVPGLSRPHDPLRGRGRRFRHRLQGAHARRAPSDAHVLPHEPPGGVRARRSHCRQKTGRRRNRSAHGVLHPRRHRNRVLTVTKAHVGSPRSSASRARLCDPLTSSGPAVTRGGRPHSACGSRVCAGSWSTSGRCSRRPRSRSSRPGGRRSSIPVKSGSSWATTSTSATASRR